MSVPLAVSAFKDQDGEAEDVNFSHVYKAWVPMAVVYALEMIGCSFLGPKIGWDMIEQRSKNINFRDAMRSSMTNQAVISALFLTVAWPMTQSDPPVSEGDSPQAFFV